MKYLILLVTLFISSVTFGQDLKYEAYKFTDEAELIQVLDTEGFEYETLKQDFVIYKDGESLDFHYSGTIITNYPKTDSTWIPTYSTQVYCLVARKGVIKLPSENKVGGNDRKYYYDYICKFNGEWIPED